MVFCPHLAGHTSPQSLLMFDLESLNSEKLHWLYIACIQITLDTELHSDCSLITTVGCTEEVDHFKDETRGRFEELLGS